MARICALLLFLVATIAPAHAAGLTSPAVDATLYRDGEVQHLSGQFGRWRVECDEVTRLRQRFCSLHAALTDAAGANIATVTVSSGDDNRPVGLVELPLGTLVRSGVVITLPVAPPSPPRVAGKRKNEPPAPLSRTINLISCDQTLCSALWPLTPIELQVLNSGKALQFAFVQSVAIQPAIAALDAQPRRLIQLALSADGFAAAVSASLK